MSNNTQNSETQSHYAFTRWAKGRLAEMNHTMEVLDSKASQLDAETKETVSATLDQMRQKYSDLEKTVTDKGNEAKTKATKAWDDFETAFEGLKESTLSKKEAFDMRIAAQRRAWQQSIEAYEAILEQIDDQQRQIDDQQRQKLKVALEKFKQKRDAVATRLDALHQAGSESQKGLSQALKESRAAFEKAANTMHENFSDAGHKG